MDGRIPARRKPVVDQVFGDNKAPMVAVLGADFAHLIREVEEAEAMAAEANTKPKTDHEQAALGAKIMDLRQLWKRVDGAREDEKRPILTAGRDLDSWFKGLTGRIEDAVKPLTDGADAYVRQKAAEERERARREAEEARRKAEEERARAEAARSAAVAGRAEGRAEAHEARADEAAARAAASTADLAKARVGGISAGARETWVARILDYQAAIAPLGALGAFLKRDAVEAALNSLAKVQKGGAVWPGVEFGPEAKAAFRK